MNAPHTSGPIDAEMKMREIDCFWKEGWEYDHTHHTYIEPKVTKAHFFLGKGAGEESVNRLYDVMGQFATKLKVEQGDETGMRIRTHIHSRNTYASMGEEEHIPRIVKAV